MSQTFEILDQQLPACIKLEDIKSYLRINYDYDDEFLKILLTRAISYAENFLRYSITCKKIMFVTTNIPHNYKRLKLPVLYCKKIIEVKNYVQDNEIELEANKYELTEDRTHLWIFVPNKIRELKVIYETEEKLLSDKSLQQSILTHISDMYDHKENNVVTQSSYLNHRRILI